MSRRRILVVDDQPGMLRAVRGEGSILDAIKQPELAAEITLQPVRRYGVDAAILYSDIVVPAHAVGFGLTVTPGVGPEVESPFRGPEDLRRLRPLDPEADTPYVLETVRQPLLVQLPIQDHPGRLGVDQRLRDLYKQHHPRA